jgi:hypothetical protein
MPMPNALSPSSKSLVILSRLLFPPRHGELSTPIDAGLNSGITNINRDEFEDLLKLADSNHVVVRGFEIALKILRDAQDDMRAEWVLTALEAERARVKNAIPFLHAICAAFEEEGLDATVIKSLDHWPDLGSDLDMYTNADPEKVIELMTRRFQAKTASRSWGDRLACKWNFDIPGLPEAVEIHMRRLGQTGEQITLATRIAGRARSVRIGEYEFRVPAVSDRLMISTLQRMYRHFYFRLCDIVDTTEISEAGAIDYEDLRSSANASGIWEGVATYMAIVSDYVKQYRGAGLDLPHFVTAAARFGGDQVYYRKDFLRVPILPQSARLYGTQLTGLMRKGELHSSARLVLLPWLATAAAVGLKVTGSDKGIW